MKQIIDKDYVTHLVDELIETTTSETFLNELYKVTNAETDNKYEVADEFATIKNLKSKGIKVPDSMRISLRNFEIPIDTSKTQVTNSKPMVCYETGCASVLYNDTLVTITLDDEESPKKKFSKEEIKVALMKEFEHIVEFAKQTEFQDLLAELYNLPQDKRREFVLNTILNSNEISKRNISIPEGILIRRSYFTDNRPTLFCITKKTPLAYPWDKATLTFDNPVAN